MGAREGEKTGLSRRSRVVGQKFSGRYWKLRGKWLWRRRVFYTLIKTQRPWPVWLSRLGGVLPRKRSLVRFLARARAWVTGHVRKATDPCFCLTLMFLSLSFSLPSPFSKNKYIKSLIKKIKENPSLNSYSSQISTQPLALHPPSPPENQQHLPGSFWLWA